MKCIKCKKETNDNIKMTARITPEMNVEVDICKECFLEINKPNEFSMGVKQ